MNCCIDWLTFTILIENNKTAAGQAVDLAREILPNVEFEEQGWQTGNGRYRFNQKLAYQGIEILFDGQEKAGLDIMICLNMSGRGCRTWEENHNGDIMGLLKMAIERAHNVSRVDLAVDDLEDMLDIDKIYQLSGMRYKKDGTFSDSCYWWGATRVNSRLQGTDGTTCYYGSNTSDIRIRIYDKAAEQGINRHWVRVETVLRGEKAKAAVEEIINEDQPGRIFVSILRKQLLFWIARWQNLIKLMLPSSQNVASLTGGLIFCSTLNRLR